MTQPRASEDLDEALRRALAELSAPVHPGRLRQRLEAELGPVRAAELRREVHQVVAAAEDNLPTRLARINPLTPSALGRLSADLAAARGWAPETAERASRTWVAALGHPDLAAAPWPVPPAGASRPAASVEPDLGVTAAPPARADAHRPEPGAPVAWPKPRLRLRKAHPTSTSGEPALGVVQSYAGVPLLPFVAALTLFTLVLVSVVFVLPRLVAAVVAGGGVLGAGQAAALLRYGALIATDTGLEFVPYVRNMRVARPEQAFAAPWSEVEVSEGIVSAVRFAGQRVQVGPVHRAFAKAAAARAGRVAP